MSFDLIVIGAGPAGMAASIAARRFGLNVACVDDQPAPGGQIWRAVETVAATPRGKVLGPSYLQGTSVAEAFRASGTVYFPNSQVWQIEQNFQVCLTREGRASAISAPVVLLATGAQERPVPFPGWTTPGVLTVGAAQILLKTSGQVPTKPVWIVGCGPLPMLYATQLLQAGGAIAGWLDTSVSGFRMLEAMWRGKGALVAPSVLWKGLSWISTLRRSGVRIVRDVEDVRVLGHDIVEQLTWRTSSGKTESAAADVVLVHEGVIPSTHVARSLGCEMRWDPAQDCHSPLVDEWGETSRSGVFIAGDGVGIGGAESAIVRGELAALGVAIKLNRLSTTTAAKSAQPLRRKLHHALAIRPLLDALYRPRASIFAPSDETIVCRCEELTAGQLRAIIANVEPVGANQLKTFSRAGMGPCQGRQCGATVIRMMASARGCAPSDILPPSVRPPLKPVTLGELALLQDASEREDTLDLSRGRSE